MPYSGKITYGSGPRSLRDLAPGSARLCLAVERFCLNDLRLDLRHAEIVLAFSGGADSLALLYCLRVLSSRYDLVLTLAILDHGLRPEAVEEVESARELAFRLGLECVTERVDVNALAKAGGIGLEEAGRNARLAFLERVRTAGGNRYIAFGHQLNDLAEDSLMRLSRGAGWPALAGMDGVDEARHIIRPLLLTPRADIEYFLRSLGVPWMQDPLNNDLRYFRNRIRSRVLPAFLAENPSFLAQVAQRWRLARLDAEHLKEQLADHIASSRPYLDSRGTFIAGGTLRAMHPALRLRLYKQLLDQAGPGQARALTLWELDAAWQRGEGGKELRFQGGKRAKIHQGGVLVYCADTWEY